MAKSALFIPFFVGSLFVAGAISARLTVYENKDFDRVIFDGQVDAERCTNLKDVEDRASSAKAYGSCVFLYENLDCRGGMRLRVSADNSVADFESRRFNDMASSARACCPPATGAAECYKSWEVLFLQSARLQLFAYINLYGLFADMVLSEECTNLDGSSIDRAESLDTVSTCAIIYDKLDCMGSRITVFPGSANQGDLNKLGFARKARSARACCEQRDWSEFDAGSPIMPAMEQHPPLRNQSFSGLIAGGWWG